MYNQNDSAPHPDTIILALGNPLRGDDGIGPAILQQLTQINLPSYVTPIDGGTPGLETLLLLQDYQRAIIIDAADMECEPGDWKCFSVDDAQLANGNIQGSLHYAGLSEALMLGEALGILPDEIIVYGIQPHTIGWAPGLSDIVKATIPEICTSIMNKLQNEVKTTWLKEKS